MSKIFFKFKAAKDYDSCVFDGPSLSVFDLKKEIMVQKKLGKGLDFDLSICDAQTNEEFTDDQYQVPRNSSVIVRRVPAAAGQGTAQRYLSGAAFIPRGVQLAPSASSIAPSAPVTTLVSSGGGNIPSISSSTAPLPTTLPQRSTIPGAEQPQQLITGATEEDQLLALHQHTGDYWKNMSEELHKSQMSKGLAMRPRQPRPPPAAGAATATPTTNPPSSSGATYVPTHSFSLRPPPPNYICYRCGVKGHWLQACPTLGDPTYDNIRVKKTTGIPRTLLKSVASTETGGPAVPAGGTLMVTSEGERVIVQLNDDVWVKKQGGGAIHLSDDLLFDTAREFAREPTQAQGGWIPEHLSCFLCQGLSREAVRMNCCRALFCDRCIRETLQRQAASMTEIDPGTAMPIMMHCPKCTKHADSDNIVVDKPTRAFVEKQLRKVAEEIRRRATGGSSAVDETTEKGDEGDTSNTGGVSKEQNSSSTIDTKNINGNSDKSDKNATDTDDKKAVESSVEGTSSANVTSSATSQDQRGKDDNRTRGDVHKEYDYKKRERSTDERSRSHRDDKRNDDYYHRGTSRRSSYEKESSVSHSSDRKYRESHYDKEGDKKNRDDKYYEKGSRYSRDRYDQSKDYRKRSRSPAYSRKEEDNRSSKYSSTDYRKRIREDEGKYKSSSRSDSRDRGRDEKYKSSSRGHSRERRDDGKYKSSSRGHSRERGRDDSKYKSSSRGHSRERGRDDSKYKSSSRGHSRERGRDDSKYKTSSRGHSRERRDEDKYKSSSRGHSRERGRDDSKYKPSSRGHSKERNNDRREVSQSRRTSSRQSQNDHDDKRNGDYRSNSRRSSENRIRSPSPVAISL